MKDIRLWGILILALAVRAPLVFAVLAEPWLSMTADSIDYMGSAPGFYRPVGYPPERGFYHLWCKRRALSGALHPYDKVPAISHTPAYPALLGAAVLADPKASFAFYPAECPQGTPPPVEPDGHPYRDCFPGNDGPWVKLMVSVQVLLDLHLVMLTFLLGRMLAGHGTGLVAALLQGVSPLAAVASCTILPESIFAFLLALAVVMLVRHFRTNGWASLLAAGVVMAAGCYFNPMGLAFAAIMLLVVAMRPKQILHTAAFGGVVASCLAPWVVRNAMVADYRWFCSSTTDSLYWRSAAEVQAHQEARSAEQIRERFREDEGGDYRWGVAPDPCNRPRDLTAGGLARYRWGKAHSIISAHPWCYAGIHFSSDMAFWLPAAPDVIDVLIFPTEYSSRSPWGQPHDNLLWVSDLFAGKMAMPALAAGMVVIFVIRCAGVILCGLWRFRPRRMTAQDWLCVLLVLTAWLLPGPANSPRFRVPLEPILSVAAAIGYAGLIAWFRRRRSQKSTEEAQSQVNRPGCC